jgi:hypothetical protein
MSLLAVENVGDSGLKRRRRRRKVPDGRTWVMRRTKTLAKLYAERLGEAALDPITAAAIQRAAELTALAEDLRQQALRGLPIPADDIVRTTRLAAQSVKQLHLDRHKPQPVTPDPLDYARQYDSEAAK